MTRRSHTDHHPHPAPARLPDERIVPVLAGIWGLAIYLVAIAYAFVQDGTLEADQRWRGLTGLIAAMASVISIAVVTISPYRLRRGMLLALCLSLAVNLSILIALSKIHFLPREQAMSVQEKVESQEEPKLPEQFPLSLDGDDRPQRTERLPVKTGLPDLEPRHLVSTPRTAADVPLPQRAESMPEPRPRPSTAVVRRQEMVESAPRRFEWQSTLSRQTLSAQPALGSGDAEVFVVPREALDFEPHDTDRDVPRQAATSPDEPAVDERMLSAAASRPVVSLPKRQPDEDVALATPPTESLATVEPLAAANRSFTPSSDALPSTHVDSLEPSEDRTEDATSRESSSPSTPRLTRQATSPAVAPDADVELASSTPRLELPSAERAAVRPSVPVIEPPEQATRGRGPVSLPAQVAPAPVELPPTKSIDERANQFVNELRPSPSRSSARASAPALPADDSIATPAEIGAAPAPQPPPVARVARTERPDVLQSAVEPLPAGQSPAESSSPTAPRGRTEAVGSPRPGAAQPVTDVPPVVREDTTGAEEAGTSGSGSAAPAIGRSRRTPRAAAPRVDSTVATEPNPIHAGSRGQGAAATETGSSLTGAGEARATSSQIVRRSTGAIPVEVEAAEGVGGLARDLPIDVGLTHRQAQPESQQVADNIGRFLRRPLSGPPSIDTQVPIPAQAYQTRMERRGAAPAGGDGRPSPRTEEAIELGLSYLAAQQQANGSWRLARDGETDERRRPLTFESDSAASGLALLSFLGAGYHHRSEEYGHVVRAGLEYLISNQQENGDLFVPADPASNQSAWLYSHAIASIALCEAFGMTQDPALRQPAQRAVDFIIQSQHPRRGGWRYEPRVGSDTSVSGWMVMALRSAELANLVVPRDAWERVVTWLDLAQASPNQPELYRYNPLAPDTIAQGHGRRVTKSMTAVGMLMRMYTGWRRDDRRMMAGADYLMNNLPEVGSIRDPQRDTYYWYYATQVMFHMRGEYWERWNGELHELLTSTQQQAGPLAGSWDPWTPLPDRWAPHAGRLYVTTMNLLSLEVYYRHLPIYEDTAR